CGPGQAEPPTCEELLASLVVDFPANDGDNVPLNRAMPATGPGANVADPSMIGPEIGIPVWNNRFYRLGLRLDEVDGRLFDELGVDSAVLSASNGWLLGAHTARGMVYGKAGEPGDFSAEFEVRDAPLPDLRPVGLKVTAIPGTGKHQVCVPVQ